MWTSGKQRFEYKRKEFDISGPTDEDSCPYLPSIWAYVKGDMENSCFDAKNQAEKLKQLEEGYSSIANFKIGSFNGWLGTNDLKVKKGHGSPSGYTDSYMTAVGEAWLFDKAGQIAVHLTYWTSGEGCWNNSQNGNLLSAGAALHGETQSIFNGVTLVVEK